MCVACKGMELPGDEAVILGMAVAQIMTKDNRLGKKLSSSLCEKHQAYVKDVMGVRLVMLAEAIERAYA